MIDTNDLWTVEICVPWNEEFMYEQADYDDDITAPMGRTWRPVRRGIVLDYDTNTVWLIIGDPSPLSVAASAARTLQRHALGLDLLPGAAYPKDRVYRIRSSKTDDYLMADILTA